ncbi:MAG: phospholipid carrier-dependent glycosyltransferase [Candidatus Eremiobacteraeota bacterium]|nr:phospholipid carrier-dependent glycosyltransferase [Candidatus Eremiobacteraeota bacterium]
MRWPLDHLTAAGLTIASFVLLYVRYWFPPEKIFDEIYFARAAEEYLQRRYIYEFTHPPLTKLLITASTMLFGGLHGGDTSAGWRFLDVVFGALMVGMLYVLAKRITGSTLFSAYAAALLSLDGMHFVQSRIATPESFVGFFSLATIYTFYRYWKASSEAQDTITEPRRVQARWIAAGAALAFGAIFALLRFGPEITSAKVLVALWAAAGLYLAYRIFTGSRRFSVPYLWLTLFALSISCLVTSKWYGVMSFGVVTIVVAASLVRHRDRRKFELDTLIATVAFVLGLIYGASYAPQFIGLSDTQGAPPRAYTLSDIVQIQVGMYNYHAHLVATHPYSSQWWQWPLDLRPILYYANYGHGAHGAVATAAMIYSLPNPFILWPGLLCVIYVGFLAYKERNRGYALLILTYLLQWLPWARSPRLAFAYHFYVDIPITCLCIAIVMQRVLRISTNTGNQWFGRALVAFYFAVALGAFVYFYPELAGITIPYDAWHSRLWLDSWI